jgi:hypothetical protein
VRPFLRLTSFEHLKPLIVDAHIVACLLILGACEVFFWDAIRREGRLDNRITLAISSLCLSSSQLMPNLAFHAGYVDVYLVCLMVAGFWLMLNKRYFTAALVASVGPVIHESFIFLWSTAAILLIWSCAMARADLRKKLLAAALPVLSTVAVSLFHSQKAAAVSIQGMSVSQDTKNRAIYAFGQTVRSSVDHMLRYEFSGHLSNLATAVPYFLLPSAGLIWAAIFCYRRRWTARLATVLVAVAATIAPLTILMLAWDLSRFLIWSNLAAAMVLIGLGSPSLWPGRVE